MTSRRTFIKKTAGTALAFGVGSVAYAEVMEFDLYDEDSMSGAICFATYPMDTYLCWQAYAQGPEGTTGGRWCNAMCGRTSTHLAEWSFAKCEGTYGSFYITYCKWKRDVQGSATVDDLRPHIGEGEDKVYPHPPEFDDPIYV